VGLAVYLGAQRVEGSLGFRRQDAGEITYVIRRFRQILHSLSQQKAGTGEKKQEEPKQRFKHCPHCTQTRLYPLPADGWTDERAQG
jgi:hypothetical protein